MDRGSVSGGGQTLTVGCRDEREDSKFWPLLPPMCVIYSPLGEIWNGFMGEGSFHLDLEGQLEFCLLRVGAEERTFQIKEIVETNVWK